MKYSAPLLTAALLLASLTACTAAPAPAAAPSSAPASTTPAAGALGDDTLAAALSKATVHVEVAATDADQKTVGASSVDIVVGATKEEYRGRSVATVDGRSLETRVVDGACYVRALGTGAGFGTVDAADCPLQVYDFDFAALTSELAATASALKPQGTERLDGVEATAYTLSQTAAGASKTMWIGSDDLPRKVEIVQVNGMKAVYLYTKWGEQLTVDAPTAAEMAS